MRYAKRFITFSRKTVNNYIKQYTVIPEKTDVYDTYFSYFLGAGTVLNFVIAFKIRENNREQNLKKEICNEMIKYKL